MTIEVNSVAAEILIIIALFLIAVIATMIFLLLCANKKSSDNLTEQTNELITLIRKTDTKNMKNIENIAHSLMLAEIRDFLPEQK